MKLLTNVSDLTKKSPQQPKVDENQIKKAINALLQHHNKDENDTDNLLGNDTNIHIQLGLAKSPNTILENNDKPNLNPKRIPIPHSLYEVNNDGNGNDNNDKMIVDSNNLEEAKICIFVKDDKAKELIQEIQQTTLLSSKSKHLQHIKKIIHLTKLRKNYNTYQQRIELVNEYDVFFVDDRVLPMVGSCLGKIFYKKKKQPIPIRLSWDLPLFIRDCLFSTYMVLPVGLCISIRAGRTNMPSEHIVENCSAVITNAVAKIPNQWSNIQSIHVKLTNSIALPIYNATLVLPSLAIDTIPSSNIIIKKDDEDDVGKSKNNVEKKNNPILKALDKVKKENNDATATTSKRKKVEEDDEHAKNVKKNKKKNKKGNKDDNTKKHKVDSSINTGKEDKKNKNSDKKKKRKK